MRVISGLYRSRKLDGYDVIGIRPTMDRVKESLFAMINSNIKDSVCLDLFGGTGSLGIEALSNGASFVYFVDNSNVAIDTIKSNLNRLNINDKGTIVCDNYTDAIKKFGNNNLSFDIIFLDPPYGKINISTIIKKIVDFNILKDDGIIVCEYEDEELKDTYGNIELFKSKKYGSTNIKIYINRK